MTILVGGVFDAFHLAEELDKRGVLERIITSYPYFKVRAERVRREKVLSIVGPEILFRSLWSFPGFGYGVASYYKGALLGALAGRHLENCNLLFAYSGSGLEALRRARALGVRTILSRSSCHIQYQQEVLKEESSRWGMSGLQGDIAHSRMVAREQQEYEEADYIRVPSLFARGSFLAKGVPAHKLLVIPHGVDLRDFRPVTKEDQVFRVLYVGGITLRKGALYLLEAMRNLRIPNSELVFIGGMAGEMKPLLGRYDGLFRHLGVVNRRKLYSYYSQASVLALPSLEEGMAYVIPEAMACGLPVVITEPTGGTPLVRDGVEGFVVPTRDPEAIAERLRLLYEDEERRSAMGRAALERVRRYPWDRVAGYAIECFQSVLDGRRPDACPVDL